MNGIKFLYKAIEYYNLMNGQKSIMTGFYAQQYAYYLKLWKELN